MGKTFTNKDDKVKELKRLLKEKSRELENEAALEKVRARTMAMHKSIELHDVIKVISEQIIALGIKFDYTTFIQFNNDKSIEVWVTTPEQPYPAQIHIPFIDHPFFKMQSEMTKMKSDSLAEIYDKEEKNRFFRHFFENTTARNIPKERQNYVLQAPGMALYTCRVSSIYFSTANYNCIPYTDEETGILNRFAKVFEQAYTRFLDLQKAEAQTKEAEIQLALERVRARTMAMHKSEELAETVAHLFKQLEELGIKPYRCNLAIVDQDKEQCQLWSTTNEGKVIPFAASLPLSKSVMKKMYDGWKKQEHLIQKIAGNKRLEWINYLNNYVTFKEYKAENIDLNKLKKEPAIFNTFSFKQGFFVIHTVSDLKENELEIIQRFAKVFQQTYTRFLDLQKAEAQAREAQIEVALERVRAKAMAMHTSNDLKDVARELRRQMGSLGLKELETCAIHLYEGSNDFFTSWAALQSPGSKSEITLTETQLPRKGVRNLEKIIDCYNKKKLDYVIENNWEDFQQFSQSLKLQAPEALKVVLKTNRNLTKNEIQSYWSVADFKGGSLLLSSTTKPEEAYLKLLRRFANVFDLAYQRFSDLKKAEEQAREAQIEAALERVRNRTLLMKNSKELNEAVAVFFNEFKNLNLLPPEARTYFCDINTNNNTAEVWMTETDGKVMDGSHFTPLTKSASLKKYYKAWKNKLPISERIYTGKTLKEYLDFVSSLPHVKKDKDYQKIFKSPPEKIIMTDANFLQGNIGIMTFEKLSEEALAVLKRFARAFEFTYTRFLDLQKAEAQAREAQIEAALEKVRATAMAMQESTELNKVIREVSEQLTLLGFDFDITNIVTDISPEGFYIWNASPLESIISGVYVPYKNLDFIKWNYSNKEKNKTVSARFTKAQKNAFFRHYFTKTEGKNLSPERKKYVLDGQSLDISTVPKREFILDVLNYRGIIYSDEQNQILYRFANVFEQAYARFLDLKKAEAQAREAQIETALERVRSRSLGMQKSEELQNVVSEVFEQLQSLDFALDGAAFIGTRVENFMGIDFWMEDKITQPACFRLPYYDAPSINDIYDAWEKGKDFVAKIYGKEKNIWFEYAFKHTELNIVPEDRIQWILAQSHLTQAVAFGKNSALGIHAHHIKNLTDSEIDILKRFSKVFEQGYVRFLDLKNAEAQAREAQIEAAMERVRSRSIGMQKSDELSEVVLGIDKEVAGLGISVDNSSIITDFDLNEKEKGLNNWIAVKGNDYLQKFHVPNAENTITRRFWDELANGADHYVDRYSKSEKNRYFRWLFKYSDFKIIPDERKQIVYDSDGWTRATIISKNSLLIFQRYSLTDYKKEDIEVFKRFGKVFEQAYTRFLDLQNAEKQAREAQIEAALERVRSRSLAMHKSSELKQVVSTVFEQIKELEIETYTASIFLLSEQGAAVQVWIGMGSDHEYTQSLKVPEINHPIMAEYNHYIKTRKPYFTASMNFEEKNFFWNLLFEHSDFKFIPEERKKFLLEVEAENVAVALQKNTGIQLVRYNNNSFSEKDGEILQRFTKVFEQAYTRFLDLQKAEAQAREAQIETALERVRSASMAMHSSAQLREIVQVLYTQLQGLNLSFDVCDIQLRLDDSKDLHFWTGTGDEIYKELIHWPYIDIPIFDLVYKAWGSGKTIVQSYGPHETQKFLKGIIKTGVVPESRQKFLAGIKDMQIFGSFLHHAGVDIIRYKNDPFTQADKDVVSRFAKAFEQSYVRFLDLQKAEAQAREAQIEASLERIRSRSMAMHKSDELQEVISVIFKQVIFLGIKANVTFIAINIENTKDFYLWLATENNDYARRIKLPYFKHPIHDDALKAVNQQVSLATHNYSREEKNRYYEHVLNHSDLKYMPEERKKFILDAPGYSRSVAINKHTSISIVKYATTEFSKEDNEILIRIAKVFEQAYTRFLDIQKAEEQAREAEIQLALERVRAKAMSMHNSEDVGDATTILFEELQKLGIETIRCGVGIFKDDQNMEIWSALAPEKGRMTMVMGQLDLKIHPALFGAYNSWKAGESKYSYILKGEDLQSYYQAIYNQPEYRLPYQDISKRIQAFQCTWYPEGGLYAITEDPLTENSFEIFDRFGKVFQLTYRRYLDLKEAEAKAREAQIEAALERVRAKAMAMHNSKDLPATAGVVFDELGKLGITTMRSGISIQNRENRKILLYTATNLKDGNKISLVGSAILDNHPVLTEIYDRWIRGEDYFPMLKGDLLKSYYEQIAPTFKVPKEQTEIEQYGYFISYSQGIFYGWAKQPYTDDQKKILKRFASVVNLTFKRYFDLQKAESQAREAIKQAALDRVRGEIASMRTSEDLNRITPVIWRELQALEVPFIRCGVFIVDDEQQKVQVYLTTPEGKPLAALNLSVRSNRLTKNTIEFWRKKQVYTEHWNKDDFINWTQSMMKMGQVRSAESYQGSVNAPESLNLHFVPFRQGMLYVGDVSPLPDEKIELVKTLAEVFSIAYARYEDFKQLEEAKNKIEITLNDLKAAQTQLVQAEKMASLGELTAGIAHEIQNPLNFVNNFSEVSTELLDELKEEIENGNLEEVMIIAEDVIQNLGKILHHGKRADGIVKSMLQHSRGSGGQKLPTDMNTLADEYLRLSYHGFRAKDKSFNADFKLEADESIPKIEVVPQEIGRVLLNLINNAFYAVDKRAKENEADYKPKVIVRTSSSPLEKGGNKARPDGPVGRGGLNGVVTITVSDNGPGISPEIKDKIFQPFFTTKPTGSGTGLGLSLSYDIIKAHGGEIKVESNEGKGTEFIIKIPVKS